jgi:hypothetical protein
MAQNYHLLEYDVNPTPVTGRHLAHAHKSRIERAFMAADLFTGAKVLTEPTVVQAASLAGVNRTYAHWAVKRLNGLRSAGFVPLMPHAAPKAENLPVPRIEIPDFEHVEFVRSVGVNRVLDAAVLAEAAQ